MHKLLWATLILGIALGWIIGMHSNGIILEQPAGYVSTEQLSPGNYLNENQFYATKTNLLINQPNIQLTRYTNTNSMDPVLDENSNGIELPYTGQTLHPGDIISYEKNKTLYIHRIINITNDDYTVKGDNTTTTETIQKEQLRGILIGILY